MIDIVNSSGERLARYTRQASPIIYSPKIIFRELLDGTHHVQTIGEPSKSIELELIATKTQCEQLAIYQGRGDAIRLRNVGGVTYEALMQNVVKWKLAKRGKDALYSGTAKFLIRLR